MGVQLTCNTFMSLTVALQLSSFLTICLVLPALQSMDSSLRNVCCLRWALCNANWFVLYCTIYQHLYLLVRKFLLCLILLSAHWLVACKKVFHLHHGMDTLNSSATKFQTLYLSKPWTPYWCKGVLQLLGSGWV